MTSQRKNIPQQNGKKSKGCQSLIRSTLKKRDENDTLLTSLRWVVTVVNGELKYRLVRRGFEVPVEEDEITYAPLSLIHI